MQDSLFSRPRPPAQPIVEEVQGVSRVVDYIRRLIAQNRTLAGIRVRGEVSGRSQVNGRLYFDLKENADVLKCVVWAGDAAKLAPFKDGNQIVCGGDYGTFGPRSQYQLVVKSVELSGTGALYARFEALREKFRKEGLFEEERKRAMPAFPQRIAVVSAHGKGAEDFLTTIAKRAPHVRVHFVESRVQGDGAQIEIGEAIRNAGRLEVDVIVVTRGGGSYEDLFPFNLEPVVRAIEHSPLPVLSAIGHTGDVHLSDLVADHSCETPSNAAQYFGEIADRFLARLQSAQKQLERSMSALASNAAQRFDSANKDFRHAGSAFVPKRANALHALERRLDAQTPHQRLAARVRRLMELRSQLTAAARYCAAPRAQRLARLSETLARLQQSGLRTYAERLRHIETRLNGLDPQALLARGYAIVTLDGTAVRDANAVPIGAMVQAQVQHGTLLARVEGSESNG